MIRWPALRWFDLTGPLPTAAAPTGGIETSRPSLPVTARLTSPAVLVCITVVFAGRRVNTRGGGRQHAGPPVRSVKCAEGEVVEPTDDEILPSIRRVSPSQVPRSSLDACPTIARSR